MPEKTSMCRASGFNRAKTSKFFSVLEEALFCSDGTRKILPEQIFNVDETGFTVCQKAQKIVDQKGKKAVGILSSIWFLCATNVYLSTCSSSRTVP